MGARFFGNGLWLLGCRSLAAAALVAIGIGIVLATGGSAFAQSGNNDQIGQFAKNYDRFVDPLVDLGITAGAERIAKWRDNADLAGSISKKGLVFSGVVKGLTEAPEVINAAKDEGIRGFTREASGAAVQVGLDVAVGIGCGKLAVGAGTATALTGFGAVASPFAFVGVFLACQYIGSKIADAAEVGVETVVGHAVGAPPNRAGSGSGSSSGSSGRGQGAVRPSAAGRGSGGVSVGNLDLSAATGDVTSVARGSKASAETDIAVARGNDGGDVRISSRTGDVVTTASGRNSNARVGVGVAQGGGRISARTGDVVATARGNESATVQVGEVSGGGRVSVRTNDVVAVGNSDVTIGSSHGGSVGVRTGDVVSNGKGGNTSINIGSGGSASVGDVISNGGSLKIGGTACVGQRNGQCCIKFHRGWCTTSIVPQYKGQCPPRYERWGGLCYLYSDKRHKVQK